MQTQISNSTSRLNFQVIILAFMIFIVALVIVLAFINSREEASRQKIILDIEQIQEALKIFFNENSYYPTSINAVPVDIEQYLEFWPMPPKPLGECKKYPNVYAYESIASGTDYKLSYCLNNGLRTDSSRGE